MNNEFIKAAIVGHPVAHSKSPAIHNYWIRKYGLSGEYGALDVRPENLAESLKLRIKEGYKGLNFTLPHKEHIFDLCDETDELAKAVGAVNTVIIKGKKLFGTNTDVFGFTHNIEDNAAGFEFSDGPAVILGAGGAARAALHGLLRKGAPEVRILNRTREKAEAIAKGRKNVRVYDWDHRADYLDDINLLVNTTSLGLAGQGELELDMEKLNPKAVVNDMIYAPLITKFLLRARERGNPIVTGIGMLLHQARPAFKSWFGVLPDLDTELLKMVSK